HLNACIGLAEVLAESGHLVTFAVSNFWGQRLSTYVGIEDILAINEPKVLTPDPNLNAKPDADFTAKRLKELLFMADRTPLDKVACLVSNADNNRFIASIKYLDDNLSNVIEQFKPDVLFVDISDPVTTVIKSGIPWVLVCSANPLRYFNDDCFPPAMSGLPSMGDRKEWKSFRDSVKELQKQRITVFNEYLNGKGVEMLKETGFMLMRESCYLNIYGYPLELDYQDIRPLPPNWFRFDNLKRNKSHLTFDMPMKLQERPGKLVYFSLGSMGAVDVDNMKRLVNILSKSKHRFIVSKGPLHNKYSLADNMWGEGSVPQIQVLPLVDLVITHGGNNTVTETFYFGKPMIVLPLWTDQYDNAQRVHEKGFGIRLDAYKCSEEELLNAIERIGESLVRAGHRVMFLINEQWRGRLTKYGIEEVLYESWTENKESDKNMALKAAMSAKRIGLMTDRSPLDKMVAYWGQLFPDMTQKWPKTDEMIERYIDKLCPDLIIIDHVVYHTSVVKSGIPWVWVCSCNPLLLIDDNRTPPHGSGFPIDSDENEWKIFRQTVKDVTIESSKRFNEYIIARGLKALNDCQYFTPSPYLNVYPFPAELDYNDVRPLPPNHYRFDNFMRTHNDVKFEIPLPLRDKPGKLIYFSLGSMGAADVDNMKRLVNILSKSKHRFIVSKGPLHDEYSLADNMWGEGSVPQIQVLPLVDLVITHGGNNTVTDTSTH
ncbi:unnamed protein product, partial [Medioppia subpectinata]